jgi:hypothetical protein
VGRQPLAQDQKNARRRKAVICFFDESGVSLTPIVRSTWAPRGKTPLLVHRFNWKRASIAAALCFGADGGGCRLAFHVQPGSYNTERLIGVLGELRVFLGGQKATLLWDGLPAHRSNLMKAWIASQRDWLVVERLPAYAPELNPTEGLWSSLKAVELAKLCGPSLAEVITQAHRGGRAPPPQAASGLLIPPPDRPSVS